MTSGAPKLEPDTLAFTVTTHDAGYKLTELDFDLARRIDGIAIGPRTGSPGLSAGAAILFGGTSVWRWRSRRGGFSDR